MVDVVCRVLRISVFLAFVGCVVDLLQRRRYFRFALGGVSLAEVSLGRWRADREA